MKTKTFDWSGKALIIGGVLIALAMLIHPDDTLPSIFIVPLWAPVHFALGIGVIIVLGGLVGLYAVMGPKLNVFGRVSFWLTMLASVLLAGVMLFFEAALLPVLSADPAYAPILEGPGSVMNGLMGYLIWFTMVIGTVGFLMLAFYLVVTKTISPVNGILFIGVPLAAFAPPLPYVVEIVGGVMFGTALAWLGVSIEKGTAHKALEETVRLYDECVTHAGSHA